MFPLPQIWYNFSCYSFPPNRYLSARPCFIQGIIFNSSSSAHLFSVTCLFHFLLHPSLDRAPIHPAAQPHSSASPSSSSLKCFHIWFFRNREGLILSINTHIGLCLKIQKLPFRFPSSHPLHASSMRAVRSCFIMPKHRGWKLINGAHT